MSASPSLLLIRDADSGAEYSVDYLHPSTRATTYKDLLSLLHRLHHLSTSHHQLLYTDDSGAQVPLTESDPITAAHPTLLLSPLRFELRLHQSGVAYPSDDGSISMDCTATVAQLKAQLSREMEEPCTTLTHDGQVLSDDAALLDLGLSPTSLNLLYGRFRVVVSDVETERQTTVDDLHPALTIADVKRSYAAKEKRVNVDRAELSILYEGDARDTLLSDSTTLHSAHIQHGSLLHLKTPPYSHHRARGQLRPFEHRRCSTTTRRTRSRRSTTS